jgi:hypothetical protein
MAFGTLFGFLFSVAALAVFALCGRFKASSALVERPLVPGEAPFFHRAPFHPSGVAGARGGVPAAVVRRIVEAEPIGQALRVLVTGLGSGAAPSPEALTLGRALAQSRSVILVDLSGEAGSHGRAGLHELLSGAATFDQAIQRDEASRLHVLAGGAPEGAPGLDIVLEALASTYECLILCAPTVDGGGLALSLAASADFAALVCEGLSGDPATRRAWQALRQAGRAEILGVAVDSSPASKSLAQRLRDQGSPSIHLMSGMTGRTQASPTTT